MIDHILSLNDTKTEYQFEGSVYCAARPTMLVSNQGSDQLNVNAISHFNFKRGMILGVLGAKESVLSSQT